MYFLSKNSQKKKLNKQNDLTDYIRHLYDNYLNAAPETSDYIDGYFPGLPIIIDLENLSCLFRYLNYKIIGDETKLQWTDVDGLIVIISCI